MRNSPIKTRLQAAKQYVRVLKERLGENLVQVILFGSVAKGEATNMSDTDIFILLKKRSSKLSSLISSIAHEIDELYDFSVCISNIVRSEKECVADGFLFRTVTREGIELYAIDGA